MTTRTRTDPAAMLRDGPAIDRAMLEAQRRVVLRHRALGLPLVIWRDGHVTEVSPHTIEISKPDPAPRVASAPTID